MERLSDHLPGLLGFVYHICGGKVTKRTGKILRRLQRTRLLLGIVVDPEGDKPGRILVNSLVHELSAIVFYGGALLDGAGREVLAPDGTFDPEAEID